MGEERKEKIDERREEIVVMELYGRRVSIVVLDGRRYTATEDCHDDFFFGTIILSLYIVQVLLNMFLFLVLL